MINAAPQPAIVILAHTAPDQVRRLIEVFDEHPIVLHCDAKAPAEVYRAMTRQLPDRVLLAPRRDCRLASWSLVAAELECIRLAMTQTRAQHVVVMSGADYPLVEPRRLGPILAEYAGRSWVRNDPMPYPRWNTRTYRDGGRWRMRYRFLTRRDQVLFVAGKPLHVPIPRRIHPDLEPTASEEWKILARADAEAVLALLDARADLVSFGRSCYIPDESFIASLLASPRLFPSPRLTPHDPGAWLVNWPADGSSQRHPAYFTAADVARLEERLATLPPKLFARKFDPDDGRSVVDLVERRLW